MSKHLIAIGDLHGDLDACIRILLGLSLINEQGEWIARDTHLVQMGDLNDRGRDSVNLIDYLMELQKQVVDQVDALGSQFTCLVGNHELMSAEQDYSYIRSSEALQYERFWHHKVCGLDAVFRGESPYAQWIRRRPTMVVIDRVLFVHAGVDSWALDYSIAEVNQLVSNWLGHLQGSSLPEPDSATDYVVNGENGPLWHTGFDTNFENIEFIDMIPEETLSKILEKFDADLLVVGHRPTRALDYELAWPHPNYGHAVAVIDTGICEVYEGKLSACTLNMAKPERERLTAHYFKRGVGELKTTRSVREACRARRAVWAD